MASSTAGVDIKDGTGAGARTSRVRLVIAEPWWARLLRCCSYLATYATRMQRARFTRPGHKASWAIGVRVPTVNQSRGAPFLLNKLWLKRTLWCLLTMQIYPDSILIFLQGINGLHFWRILFAKLHLLNFVWNFDYNFWCFRRNYRKNYRKPIYRHLSNYRQNYRYRWKTSSNYRRF